MTIKVLEAVGSTIVNFEGKAVELLTQAKEAYGFKNIENLMGFLLSVVLTADGNILKYDGENHTSRLLPKVSMLEELTPESEEIYIDLMNKIDLKTIASEKPIEELKGLSKSQKASVKYRLACLLIQNLEVDNS